MVTFYTEFYLFEVVICSVLETEWRTQLQPVVVAEVSVDVAVQDVVVQDVVVEMKQRKSGSKSANFTYLSNKFDLFLIKNA